MDEKLFVEITRKAHKMAKQMKAEFPEVNYRTEFVICFKMLYQDEENKKNKLNFKINNIIKKDNNLKFIKTEKKLQNTQKQEFKKFRNLEEFENSNKVNKKFTDYIRKNKEVKYEKGSKHLLHNGEIEILKIFKENQMDMIEYIFLDSDIIQVTTKTILVSNILKHIRRVELYSIDIYKNF